MVGKILDNRYEILEVVGSGGMAIVYKAKCRLLNRIVAIKMLRSELKGDKDFVERFRVEAQSAASLNHPNIVSVYDVGQHEDCDYFVMEYVDGITLKELIEKRQISWQEACRYTVQICQAIDHAHKKNIVHRDIKPHNIIVTPDNVAKVTDFGIARAVSTSTIVRAGNIIGSVHYFSPEQACGGVVDFKSDIYSIGVVLYELLTGRLPFDAETPVAIAKMHVDNMAERPSDLNAEIPQTLSDIVLKAMAKQPAMRYQTVSDLAKDLRTVIEAPENIQIADPDATQFVPIVTPSSPDMATAPVEVIVPKKETITKRPEVQEKPQKRNTPAIVMWIVAAIIAIAAVVAVVVTNNPSLNAERIDVPNLIGEKYSQVSTMYNEEDFRIVVQESRYSDSYEDDTIIEQTPADGKIKKGGVVYVVVSSGTDMVTLMDYTGHSLEEVKAELDRIGIKNIVIEYETHNIYPKDTVFHQSPGGGSSIKRTASISLHVSTGLEQVKVPNLEGLSEADAKKRIEAEGLVVGEVKELETSMKAGTVISQKPLEDTLVDKGTAVSITISKSMASPPPRVTPTPAPPITEE